MQIMFQNFWNALYVTISYTFKSCNTIACYIEYPMNSTSKYVKYNIMSFLKIAILN